MSSGFRKPCGLLAWVVLASAWAGAGQARELRVCADPNNLPFSNSAGEGFENRIAMLLAADLGAELSYFWRPQRRGFLRETINLGVCDLVPGVPAGMEAVRTTRPYYRSSYVVVGRGTAEPPASLDDAAFRTATVGVQLMGDDGANSPPAHALARRGMTLNIRGYTVFGDYSEPVPGAGIMRAVASGEVDMAVVWGPLAGWFAGRSEAPLRLRPVEADEPGSPMAFSIAMGVRKGDIALQSEIQDALDRNAPRIQAILTDFGVPLLPLPARREGEK